MFAVYETFQRKAAEFSSLTTDQKKELINRIKSLNQDGKDLLYMIIRHSAHLEKDENVYRAKYSQKRVLFDLDAFPETLQKIVWLFVDKHLEEANHCNGQVDIVFT